MPLCSGRFWKQNNIRSLVLPAYAPCCMGVDSRQRWNSSQIAAQQTINIWEPRLWAVGYMPSQSILGAAT